jgi:adenylate cyclase
MFGTYVSPQLVDRMIESGEDPQLGGHESDITAYFSDIQGFSAFSEKLESGPRHGRAPDAVAKQNGGAAA